MKKLLSLLIIAAMTLSLVSCKDKDTESETEESGETVTGTVTEVNGNTITFMTFSQPGNENVSDDAQTNISADNAGQVSISDDNSDTATHSEPDREDITSTDNGEQTPPDMSKGNEEQTPPDTDGGNGIVHSDKQGDNSTDNEPHISDDETNGTSGDGETPPEIPSGDMSGEGQMDIPGGNADTGMMGGETQSVTIDDESVIYKSEDEAETKAALSDISAGMMITITYTTDSKIKKIVISDGTGMNIGGENGDMGGNGNMGGNGDMGGNGNTGGSSDVVYGGSTEITTAATENGKTYSSDTADESALLISTSEDVTINNPTVTKSGDSDGGDNCNFYGQNATLLVMGGSTTTITGGTVSSDADGANGVFSYGGNGGQNGASGDGTTVIISDTVITTTGDGSGGIMTTGGGVTEASDLTVTTSGRSSAAIRTDRGGGTVTVDGGTYTTNGLGSPAIYSTADITVSNATLTSNLSEGVCIEGLNSIELNNCNMTANNTKCNGNATFNDTIMIYQSMSGDAASGTSTFTMNGGTLTSKNGHVFHVTNTNAVITLNGVKIVNEDSDNILLSVCDDGWSGGSNKATLNASEQSLNGAILVGDNSTLTLTLSEDSSFTGYIDGNIQNADGDTVSTEVGTVSVTLDSTSTWTLTADSYVTSFDGNASNIISNGYTLYVNGVALTGTK